MSIGPDLKEVLEEVGVSFQIITYDGTVVASEYLDYEINRQVTKPFIREYFLEAFVSHDTVLSAGNYVLLKDGRRFIVMNKTPELFEDETIKFDIVLYKTNVVCNIMRLGPASRNDAYELTNTWSDVYTGIHVLLTERFYGTNITSGGALNELMEFEISNDQVYVPGDIAIKSQDRLYISSSEYYKVEFVEDRKFDNVNVVTLSEDQRG